LGKGGGNKPPDSAYKQASMYPGLQKPVDKAINEAQSLYKGGWNQSGFNPLQTGAFQGAQNLLGMLQGGPSGGGYGRPMGGGYAGLEGGPQMSGGDPRPGGGPQMSGGDPVGMGGLNFASNVAQGGAMGAPGQNFLQGVYGQQTGGPAQPMLDRLATGAEGAIPGSLAGMQATAGGANMNVAQNPYLQSAISSGNADITRDYTNAVRPGIEGRMGQAGVAGSPMEGWAQGDAQRNLADRLASNTSGIMMGQYGAERGYQNQAQMGMPGAVGTAYGTAGQAAGQGASNWLNSLNQQIGAAGQAGNQYNQGINTALGAGQGLGGQVSGMINPYLQMYGLGQSQQQAEQAMANPQWTAFNQYLQNLQGLGGMTNPAAAAQAMQGYQSGTQQGIGNLLAFGGLGAQMFGRGPTTSDIRAKKDVEPAGLGTGLYRWRYKWEGEDTPRHLGPMAQSVAEVAPSAVTTLNGLLAIPSALVER
jgi:hypothetical protein